MLLKLYLLSMNVYYALDLILNLYDRVLENGLYFSIV